MADRARIEATSRKKGRKISPELIEEILGSLGPGVIKRIAGVPRIGLRLGGKAISRPVGQAADDLGQNTDTIKQLISQRRRKLGKANINRPSGSPAGKRPPDKELEALALKLRDQARKIAQGKEARRGRLKERTKAAEGGKASLEKAEREAGRKAVGKIIEDLLDLLDE
ncbi:hypothetical protein LCGC14_2827040 [marine sediment metagenome]|uniref:Uncharacterized protein n=1 Tax=marine sediment metagenome TaxID=412755 RepID=A0A0F8YF79_9ZZZZ